MLGFFINVVVNRFWLLLRNIGWIDTSALYISKYISGKDDHARLLRRNLVRYLLFHQVLIYRDISEVIRRRFPTLETLVTAGYITELELQHFNAIESKNRKYWVPIHWAMGLAHRARKEKRLDSPQALQDIFSRINDFRLNLSQLIISDWVPIPLVYSQVMSLTVRLYFFLALMGQQNIAPSPDANYVDNVNTHIPFISMCQFIFYMGWMKVAEVLMNPFGDDDDDLEINWLIDRNLQIGMTIVDEMWEPPLIKDQFWMLKTAEPMYSVDAVNERYNPQIGSVSNINQKTSTQMIMKEMLDRNSDSDLSSSDYEDTRRGSTLSTTMSGIRNAFKRRLSRLASRVDITDVESPVPDNSSNRPKTYNSPQELRERRELTVLNEEDENRRQNQSSSSSGLKHSTATDDESDNSQERQLKRKGRKLRKKIGKGENDSTQKENCSPSSGQKIYDGDDENETQTERKSPTTSTQIDERRNSSDSRNDAACNVSEFRSSEFVRF
uniref:Bestrophin homolog n=1 Tax=Setaria digitata TaxID=48799 RepID=A0A915PD11_9BILA